MRDSLTISSRTNYSSQHIKAASFFARKAYAIQLTYSNGDIFDENIMMEYRSYSSSSIFLSVAFLEAIINEFFCDVSDEVITGLSKDLDFKAITMIKRLWGQDVPRTASFRIIQKFDIALIACEKESISKNEVLYSDITSLIQLRNALIHYEPVWNLIHSDEVSTDKGLSAKLKNKFSLNPFTGLGNAFFPDKCIAHGCAEWAVNNAITFVDSFYKKIGLVPPYEISRVQLKTR